MNKHFIPGLLLLLGSCLSLNAQALYNKGKIYVGTATATTLYIKGNLKIVGNTASITHVGKTVLTGDFINDVTVGTVFARRDGTFEFRGDSIQKIRKTNATTNKADNYITFPNSVIINSQHTNTNGRYTTVNIDPDMGATIKNLTFTHGRLVLDSKSGLDGQKRITDVAHLLAENGGTITYKHNQANLSSEGVVQVNLSLGDNWEHGRLAGFSPPFKKIYADYFFFNFLSAPTTAGGFKGSSDPWIHNPKEPLPAGHGYVLGQGLVPWTDPYYIETLNPSYSTANRNDAIKDTFVFARKLAPASLASFVNGDAALTDRYTGEELNTGDVSVTLIDGFNYLGNPYTVPLDLTELLGVSTLPTGTWGDAAPYIARKFYILTDGTGSYLPNREFRFTVNHLLIQTVGGTGSVDTIAPMQMFAIEKLSGGSSQFKIPASKRTHGNIHHLRSAANPVIDELLIETKDGMTGGYDRLCVVFRNNATLASNDPYDAPKLFNRTGGVNQIYTRSSDNKELTTTVVPPSTEKLTMYFEPASQAQEVILTADRISSISSVSNVVLEDLQTGKAVDLKKAGYRFISSPGDRADRFVLHFGSNAPVATEGLRSAPLFYAGYEQGVLWMHGIRDSQIGNAALIYDMLGNLLHRQTVTEAPYFRIEKPLSKGIYIVRLSGDESVAKFAVK